jgi:hypothetical protein
MIVASEARARQTTSGDRLAFTFSGPVMIPGATLPPGTYQFAEIKINGSQSVVKVTSEDGMQLFATTIAIPVRRLDPKSNVVVKFAETETGIAPAIRAWFAPGALTGHQFIYPEDQAKAIAEATKTLVLSADRDDLKENDLAESSIYVTDRHGSRRSYQIGEWNELPRVVSADPPDTP